MPDGGLPEPGSWNRFQLEASNPAAAVETLRNHGARFRNDIVVGIGGKQILLEDPSGNPIELLADLALGVDVSTRGGGSGRTVAGWALAVRPSTPIRVHARAVAWRVTVTCGPAAVAVPAGACAAWSPPRSSITASAASTTTSAPTSSGTVRRRCRRQTARSASTLTVVAVDALAGAAAMPGVGWAGRCHLAGSRRFGGRSRVVGASALPGTGAAGRDDAARRRMARAAAEDIRRVGSLARACNAAWQPGQA
jgi:hypothetical protein